VVRAAFEYAQARNVALAAFLGDECVTLQMHPELEVRMCPAAEAPIYPCPSCSFDLETDMRLVRRHFEDLEGPVLPLVKCNRL